MSSKVRVVCPGCSKELRLSGSSQTITCPACGKKMRLRLTSANSQATQSTPPANEMAFPVLTDLQSAEIPTNLAWNAYAQPKSMVQVKPLLISLAIVGGIIVAGGLIYAISQLSNRVDVAAVTDALRGPDDSVNAIHSQWKRNVAEHQRLLKSIQRRSDCDSLRFPFERLIRQQTELLARAALLETTQQTLEPESLPPLPVEREAGSRSFRAVAALLTTELRKLDEQLANASNALLSFFHAESLVIPDAVQPSEISIGKRIAMKRLIVRWLARVVQGTDRNEASVAIYELANEAKQLSENPATRAPNLSNTPAVNVMEVAVDRMRSAIVAQVVRDDEDAIGKSLIAFDAAWQ